MTFSQDAQGVSEGSPRLTPVRKGLLLLDNRRIWCQNLNWTVSIAFERHETAKLTTLEVAVAMVSFGMRSSHLISSIVLTS